MCIFTLLNIVMRFLIILFLLFPCFTFSQEVIQPKPLPKLEKELQNLFIHHSQKYINITDSLIARLKTAFISYDLFDTTEHIDSNFYFAEYTVKNTVFRFDFKTINIHLPDGNQSFDSKSIFLTVLKNGKVFLPQLQVYSTEYVESFVQEEHCFLVDENVDGFPDLLFAKYNYSEFVDNDKFDCKDCKLFAYSHAGYIVLDEPVSCKEILKGYNVPFVLK